MKKEVRKAAGGDHQKSLPGVPEALFDPEQFKSKEQVAHVFNIKVRTLETWMRDGLFPYIKVRKVVVFKWADVLEHLEKNCRVYNKP